VRKVWKARKVRDFLLEEAFGWEGEKEEGRVTLIDSQSLEEKLMFSQIDVFCWLVGLVVRVLATYDVTQNLVDYFSVTLGGALAEGVPSVIMSVMPVEQILVEGLLLLLLLLVLVGELLGEVFLVSENEKMKSW